MRPRADERPDASSTGGRADRPLRADAQRNIDTLLKTALVVFATSGVDAPVREIADRAGVGVGTIYRHFPQRSDLIAAVFRREIDACADAAATLATENAPFDALAKWMGRYVDFIAAKRGLAAALHSGDPAYEALPVYFDQRLRPALQGLFDTARAAGAIRTGATPNELLRAVASLCTAAHDVGPDYARTMIGLLLNGLRYGASVPEADRESMLSVDGS